MTDLSSEELVAIGQSLRRPSLAQVLADHWLFAIGCDHERGTDSPQCSCGAVSLGTYPSVGDAVAAWANHVEAKVREIRGGCA
jgi:hypothetical protein